MLFDNVDVRSWGQKFKELPGDGRILLDEAHNRNASNTITQTLLFKGFCFIFKSDSESTYALSQSDPAGVRYGNSTGIPELTRS